MNEITILASLYVIGFITMFVVTWSDIERKSLRFPNKNDDPFEIFVFGPFAGFCVILTLIGLAIEWLISLTVPPIKSQ